MDTRDKNRDDEQRQEQRQIDDQRILLEGAMREIAVMQTVLRHLETSLFGAEGREGILDKVERKLSTHDKWIYIATGAIVAMQFLSGSGVISLKGITGH